MTGSQPFGEQSTEPAVRFSDECASFVQGRGFRLAGVLGGYAFRSASDIEAIGVDGPSQRVIALGGELSVWDAASGGRSGAFPLAGTALAVEREGRFAAVGQRDGSVSLVDVSTGAVVVRASLIAGDEGSFGHAIVPPVDSVALAGPHLAGILETGRHVHVLSRRGEPVSRFAGEGPLDLSPDGAVLVAGGVIHHAATGTLILSRRPDRPAVSAGARDRASFSADGTRLARTTASGDVELWDVAALRAGRGSAALIFATTMPVAPWDRDRKPQAASAVFALDGDRIVTSTGSELQIWESGRPSRILPFHGDTVCLGAGGRTLWGVRRKRTIAAIDLTTGESSGQAGHLAEVKVIAHSPRAPLALSGGADARVILWHLPTGSVLRELRDAWGSIQGACFFPDGRRVAAIDEQRMFVWDAATKEVVAKLDRVSPRESGLRDNVDIDASPDGRHVLVCTHSDHVLLWDVEAGRTEYCREVPGVRSAAFGAAPSVAVLGSGSELIVFDLATGEPACRVDAEPDSVRYRPHLVFDQGRRAVRPCTGRGLFVYDLGTGARSQVPVTDDVHGVLAISPDGRVVAISTSDDPTAVQPVVRSEVALVDLRDGARAAISLASAHDHPTCASFSGDGLTLLVGTARGVVLRFALEADVAHLPSATAAAARSTEAATRVMSAFPDLTVLPSAAGDRVVVSPARAPESEDEPLSAMNPLGSTSPRAAGPSSAKAGTALAKREEAIAILRKVGALHARGACNEALAFAAPLRRHLFDSFPPGDAMIASAVATLAELHTRVGELREAEALHTEALERVPRTAGEGSEAFATTLSNAANFALDRGDATRAEALHRRALEVRRMLHGERHPLTAQSTSSLGFVLERLGRPDLAEPMYRSALAAYVATVGPSHPEHAKTLHNLGVLVGQAGRLAESEQLLQESLTTRRAVLAEGHPELAQGLASLGTLYLVSHRPAQAEPVYREALDIARRSLGEASVETAARAVDLAVALRALGRGGEAIPLLQRALDVRIAKLPPDDGRIAHLRRLLADCGG